MEKESFMITFAFICLGLTHFYFDNMYAVGILDSLAMLLCFTAGYVFKRDSKTT